MGESKLNYLNTNEFRKIILSKNLNFAYYKSTPIPANKFPSDDLQHNNTVTGVIDQPDIIPIDTWNERLSFYSPELVQTYQNLDVSLPDYGFNINEGQQYNPGNYQFETPTNIISILTGQAIRNADTPMARLSTEYLTRSIYSNIGENLRNLTLDRVNLDVENLLLGTEPLFTRDFQITVPGTPISRAAEYVGRITGVEVPRSYIPGEFFEDNIDNGRIVNFVNRATETIGNVLNLDLRANRERKAYSQKLLQYTSNGQKSVYYKNISYNRYKPDHENNSEGNIIQRIGESVRDFIGVGAPDENTYIGLTLMDSIEARGRFVSGYSIISKEFEIGNIPPNFMWKGSSETFDGSFVTDVGSFPDKSIISYTKEILEEFDSIQNDQEKLSHPGSVISNLSKKFFDGDKIISKGNATKGEDGEFCRVWTKDYAYDRYGRLMRTSGMTTTQRAFKGSILSSTYNLNIGPTRDEEGNALNFGGDQTKYMFSIENLAWKDSDDLNDRPLCEIGKNGGRIMWFPPYDLKFSDDTSANWTEHKILGRPEPIYTYQNTTRTGNLSFKLVVDHPSIFNKIRDRKLNQITDGLSEDEFINEFVNGCRDYDIYELGKELTFLSLNETLTLNNLINDFGKEGLKYKYTIPSIPNDSEGEAQRPDEKTPFELKYPEGSTNVTLWWNNDIPGPSDSETTSNDYFNDFLDYLGKRNEFKVENENPNGWQSDWSIKSIDNFFNTMSTSITRLNEIIETIKQTVIKHKSVFNLSIRTSASSPATQEYNKRLSMRRLNSVKNYILSQIGNEYGEYINIDENPVGERETVVINGESYSCSGNITNKQEALYSRKATFCRSGNVKITIDNTRNPIPTEPPPITNVNKEISENYDSENAKETLLNLILKNLSSECDYFTELNEESPLVFDKLEEKLKYFHPTFHSTTPEGLNSRLTFLQQCVRPGDTLKVRDLEDNEVKVSSNTSFGKPPVCVLRIGDFFHSKIIIESVQVTYDESPLDLNPEGIGVQPMIATVTMRVNYIGGQSLENAVSQIQNALSFNFYANTEVYEPKLVRENVTNGKLKKLKDLQDSFDDRLLQETLSRQIDDAEANLKDDFWGNVIRETTLTDGVDGEVISYTSLYRDFRENLNSYFTNFETLLNSNLSPYFWYESVTFNEDTNYNTTYASVKNNIDVEIEKYRTRFKEYIRQNFNTINGASTFLVSFEDNEELFSDVDKYIDSIIDHQIEQVRSLHSTILSIIEKRRLIREQINQMEIILNYGFDGYIDGDDVTVIKLTQKPNLSLDMKTLYDKDKVKLNDFVNYIKVNVNIFKEIKSNDMSNVQIGVSDVINNRNYEVPDDLKFIDNIFKGNKTPKNKRITNITTIKDTWLPFKTHFNEGVGFNGVIVYNYEKSDDNYGKILIRKFEERWR